MLDGLESTGKCVQFVLLASTKRMWDLLRVLRVPQENSLSSQVQMRMCALATLDPQERMGQEHVHHVSLVNTNQWRDLLNVQGVQQESFLLSLVQFRMSVPAMLEQLDQMGLKHVHHVSLVNTNQWRDLLNVRGVQQESFLLSLVQFRMSVPAMLEKLDQMGLKHVPRVMLVNTRQQQDLLHVLCARAASFCSNRIGFE